MQNKVLTFGEILLRMSPVMNLGWINTASMPTFIGGAELNSATALALWGIPVEYLTAMPINALSDEIILALKKKDIGTEKILQLGDRIGIYFLPQGADLKNEGVIYDRAYSAFSTLTPSSIDWQNIFKDVGWLHISAISPALNQNVADVCLEAVIEAQKYGVKISLDLNYRAKLWKYGKNPIEIMPQIAQYCDLIMGNLWAANKLLGTEIDFEIKKNNATKAEYLFNSEIVSKEIIRNFKNCTAVANTFRFDFESLGIEYYTTLYTDNTLFVSPHFEIQKVIDKVGSGDCFMAGLIYGFYKNLSHQEIIDFATSAAIGKLNEIGDTTQQKIEDVERILNRILINE